MEPPLAHVSAQPERPPGRQLAAMLIIGVATAQVLGLVLKTPTLLGGNDTSRWCTVWALLERGTYAIDDCPWRDRTVDKVYRVAPFQTALEGSEPVKRFYSSKPTLLPTLIAGLLYPARAATGVPLDREARNGRTTWPAYGPYFKPVIALLNVVPFLIFLVLYARLLDRYAAHDWAWYVSLAAAAWGTQLFAFNAVLNNHTVAAYSAFFALYPALRIWDDGGRVGARFALAGFFAALCACSELPAALFGVLLFAILLARCPRLTLLFFAPAAAVPCLASLVTQYLAHGTVVPVYAEFGTESYTYPGSYWNRPTGLDALSEPKYVYLYHMLAGHHGVLTLTPIFLFSAVAALGLLRGSHPLTSLARLTSVLTVATIAFYAWRTNNYGGSTQGLRWLFWLYPFWLALLPAGLEPARDDPVYRRLAIAALLISVFSVGYATSRPWSHPWPLDLMELLDAHDAGN